MKVITFDILPILLALGIAQTVFFTVTIKNMPDANSDPADSLKVGHVCQIGLKNLDKPVTMGAILPGSITSQLYYFPNDAAKGKRLDGAALSGHPMRRREEMLVKNETFQKEPDIIFLKKNSLLLHKIWKEVNNTRNLTSSGLVLLVLLLAALYCYHQNRLKNIALNSLVKEKDSLMGEKAWLLKEIHHRVKNNLQIVMGLLQQQSVYLDNTKALTAIKDSENRMRSIALVHQKLYLSDSLDLVFMPEYINELISYLSDGSNIINRIRFEKEFDEIYLHVSQAVPLGLILNECITNAIKYAYTDQHAGSILVYLRRFGKDRNMLIVKDHGRGFREGFNLEEIESLGLNLIMGLSKQLGGTFELERTAGVTIKITFKTDKLLRIAGND